MKRERDISIKIRRISICNYKGIDKLDMEFPLPRLVGDPDIFVMGSRNGHGKTSILECCALLLLATLFSEKRFLSNDVPDLLIRAGEDSTEIGGEIVGENKIRKVNIKIDRHGAVELSGENSLTKIPEPIRNDHEYDIDNLISTICGLAPNPVIENTFLFFHSYRKVPEGNLKMGALLRGRNLRRSAGMKSLDGFPQSAFKLLILRSMMGQANLFEIDEESESGETIEILNKLARTYAEGTISKLRPSSDNTIDFIFDPIGKGNSVTFDGLGSGQKEIISTLLLIWHHTRNRPSVVFIDEPELHLNAQWHRRFVNSLIELAPLNQYIMATHSEDIMDSVDKDRRIILSNDQCHDKYPRRRSTPAR